MLFLLRRESLWIPVILLVILIGCWSELDLYAPSFPQMMHYFSTTEQMMQWTLSLNFLGFFVASLICGPLADAFGRRKVILVGSALFVLGSLVCVWAMSIEMMLLGRLIQGIGVSAPVTVCQAVIADIYQGEQQVRLLSRTNSAITVTMALAPIFGVYLTEHFGWHSNFVVIFLVAILGGGLIFLFVPETHEQHARKAFEPKHLVSGYITLLKSKDFMSAALGMCFSITPYFVLIGILPLLFMEELGVSIGNYAFYQGSIVGLFSVLSLSIPWFLARFDLNKIAWISVVLSVLSLGGACILSVLVSDDPLLISAFMWVYVVGIVIPPTMMFAQAMDMFGDLKACASSLIQSLRMLSMSVGTALAGAMYDGSFKPVALVMFVFILLSVPMTMVVFKKNKPVLGDSLPAMH